MIHLELQPEIEAQLAAKAVAAIRHHREGSRLHGLKIADLIYKGRKY